jgi:hypothetical protein
MKIRKRKIEALWKNLVKVQGHKDIDGNWVEETPQTIKKSIRSFGPNWYTKFW